MKKVIQNVFEIPRWFARNRFLLLNKWRFKHIGKNTRVYRPLCVDGIENITLGDDVVVHDYTWLAALPLTGQGVQLVLNDGVTLGNFNHIYATNSIIIEKDVLTADKVYISDNLHNYEEIALPVIKQSIKQCKPVVIGEGSWLGEHVCVIGASIGKHCVIGANAVVTKDIPDYSITVGTPARIIKRFDFEKKEWRRTDSNGNFFD